MSLDEAMGSDIVCAAIWMCDILENSDSSDRFANNLMTGEGINRLFEYLNSSLDSVLSNHLLDCINLIFEKCSDCISTPDPSSYVDSITKSLDLALKSQDQKLFMNALTALRQLLRKNSETRITTEFSFFTILDLLSDSLTNHNLFVNVVNFSSELLTISQIPKLIPAKQLKEYLSKVVDEMICSTDLEISVINNRMSCCLNLISSYLYLIKELKHKEITSENAEFYLINDEPAIDLDVKSFSQLSQTQESVIISNNSDISVLLSTILSHLEHIFESFRNYSLKENSRESLELLMNICLCLIIIFENDLYGNEYFYPFLQRMLSSGNISFLLQLITNCHNESIDKDFKKILSSFLSNFLIQIQKFGQKNEMNQQLSQSLIAEDLRQGFDLLNDRDLFDQSLNCDGSQFGTYERFDKFYYSFFAINYYCLRFGSKFQFEDQYSHQFVRIINEYFKSHLNSESYSKMTVKHTLFLAAFCDQLDIDSIRSLKQFFDRKEDRFLSEFYTNDLNLLKWLLTYLNCDNLSKFALNKFIESTPENHKNDSKENTQQLIEFIEFINTNENAFQLLINIMCDSTASHLTLDVMQTLLTNSDQFMAESPVFNNWIEFANRVFNNLPQIIVKITERMKAMFSEVVDSDKELKLSKLIRILCQMLSNNSNEIQLYSKEFDKFPRELCYFINENLRESTIESIFEFFKICFTSSFDLSLDKEALTKDILNSTIPLILLFRFATGDCTEVKLKELSIFLLSTLTECKQEFKIEHDLTYKLDIKLVNNWLNSDSFVICKSALSLLLNSFKSDLYFASNSQITNQNNNQLNEEKVENFRKLLISLQNAVFRSYINANEMIEIWNKIFKDVMTISVDLFNHIVNNPWFRIIVEKFLMENHFCYLEEDCIDFLILFYSQTTINKPLIGITNTIVETLVQLLKNPEFGFLNNKFKRLLESILNGVYVNILDTNIREDLSQLLNENQNFYSQ